MNADERRYGNEREAEGETEADGARVRLSPRARRVAAELGVEVDRLAGLGKVTIQEADVRALAARGDASAPLLPTPAAAVEREAPEAIDEEQPSRAAASQSEAWEESPAPEPGETDETAPDDFETLVEGPEAASEISEVEDEKPEPSRVTPSPSHPAAQESEILPLTPIRRIIAARALASARDVPQFSLWIDIQTEAILRGAGPDTVRGTAAWVRAAARALDKHPRLNASFTPEGIRLHRDVHVGVTVALEDGIVVPVLHFAGRKSLDDLAAELRDLQERARTRNLRGVHLEGATFSVTDWSAFGTRGGIPLLHPPQVAHLAIGAPHDVPSLRDGGLFFRPTSEVVLVADQRALDAAHAAAFLAALKAEVEEPGC